MHAQDPAYFDDEKKQIFERRNYFSPVVNGKKASRSQSLWRIQVDS